MTSSQAESVLKLAEAELAAFLQSAHATLGCRCPLRVGSEWIEIMLSLEWPCSDFERFFRVVTILTTIRLAFHHSGPDRMLPAYTPHNPGQGENDDHSRPLTSA